MLNENGAALAFRNITYFGCLTGIAIALGGCVSEKHQYAAAMLPPAIPDPAVTLPDTMTVTPMKATASSGSETPIKTIAYLDVPQKPEPPTLSPQGMIKTATNLAESAFSPLVGAVTGGSQQVNSLIDRYAQLYEVPPELVRKVVKRESNFNPVAFNHGHWGLMQIKHATARGMGYDGPPTGLLDAETNLKYSVKYLKGAYLVANGDFRRADRLYQTGYYYDAKRAGLLSETGLGRDRVRRRGVELVSNDPAPELPSPLGSQSVTAPDVPPNLPATVATPPSLQAASTSSVAVSPVRIGRDDLSTGSAMFDDDTGSSRQPGPASPGKSGPSGRGHDKSN